MSEIIYYAISLVIAVVTFLLGKYVFPTVKQYIGELDSGTITGIASWVYKFVVSAKNQFDDNCGKQKLQYVTEQVKMLCDKYNVDLSDEQIRALIEDAYIAMKKNYNEA